MRKAYVGPFPLLNSSARQMKNFNLTPSSLERHAFFLVNTLQRHVCGRIRVLPPSFDDQTVIDLGIERQSMLVFEFPWSTAMGSL
jgi:hypothetical protein